ncbi:hypothetical protein PPL_04848 [Heterostelium album PN500]|uniref:Uncharacterized protein n=1 Tax=Heterostelium pallidum (strain ATCC 26659 / Pp 5 / PN500) TaxID=670386 RepID=D3B8Q5_HETP5|nr:hypothetical protein PPL_04848 [Heterostelium album PN500]EFA82423.1 hypothetical protein PPL_04848 [Heterostelium album PN500]|eukprot:XP_020434540.1 hypothetical protein PPL_04848 [Heterostelium album PN500]
MNVVNYLLIFFPLISSGEYRSNTIRGAHDLLYVRQVCETMSGNEASSSTTTSTNDSKPFDQVNVFQQDGPKSCCKTSTLKQRSSSGTAISSSSTSSHLSWISFASLSPAILANELQQQLMDRDAIYLVDSVNYEQQVKCQCSVFMVSSPNPEKYKEYLKTYSEHKKYWLSPWTYEEIKFAHKEIFNKFDLKCIDLNFDHWGGIPRYVFSNDTDTKGLDDAIAQCDLPLVSKFVGESTFSMSISHKILHTYAIDNGFRHTRIEFGSKYIADRITTLLVHANKNAIISFIQDRPSKYKADTNSDIADSIDQWTPSFSYPPNQMKSFNHTFATLVLKTRNIIQPVAALYLTALQDVRNIDSKKKLDFLNHYVVITD